MLPATLIMAIFYWLSCLVSFSASILCFNRQRVNCPASNGLVLGSWDRLACASCCVCLQTFTTAFCCSRLLQPLRYRRLLQPFVAAVYYSHFATAVYCSRLLQPSTTATSLQPFTAAVYYSRFATAVRYSRFTTAVCHSRLPQPFTTV